jgi:hypothetical protein
MKDFDFMGVRDGSMKSPFDPLFNIMEFSEEM